jgi:hypothetical protein
MIFFTKFFLTRPEMCQAAFFGTGAKQGLSRAGVWRGPLEFPAEPPRRGEFSVFKFSVFSFQFSVFSFQKKTAST